MTPNQAFEAMFYKSRVYYVDDSGICDSGICDSYIIRSMGMCGDELEVILCGTSRVVHTNDLRKTEKEALVSFYKGEIARYTECLKELEKR